MMKMATFPVVQVGKIGIYAFSMYIFELILDRSID